MLDLQSGIPLGGIQVRFMRVCCQPLGPSQIVAFRSRLSSRPFVHFEPELLAPAPQLVHGQGKLVRRVKLGGPNEKSPFQHRSAVN